jgi:hypothetical protein
LEAYIIDNKVEGFFKELSIRLLDAIQGLIQLNNWASLAIGVRPLTNGEAHIESLLQRAVEKSHWHVKYSNLKVMIGCKAEGKSN